MSPFQESHQPTHAGQPAGAPDEEPIASAFDGEGQPFNSTSFDAFMDPLEFAFQSAFEPTLNGQAMIFNYPQNNRTGETLEFGTGFASQNAFGPTLNETMPPFDADWSDPWMDQPIGFPDAEVASQSALFSLGQAPIASDGTQSYPQDAFFDGLDQADWINDDAGMPDALGGFADPVRPQNKCEVSRSASHWSGPSIVRAPEHVINNDGMAVLPPNSFRSPNQIDYRVAAEASEQQLDVSEVSGARVATCPTPSKGGPSSTIRARKHTESLQLKCDFEGCTHQGTFPRDWELTRHKAKHNVGPGSFVCRAEGCFNKQMPWTFTRSDKLTSHIKAVHTRDTVFAACPIINCNLGRCNLETLGVHIERKHKNWPEGRAVLNASTCKVRKCPLWRCGKSLTARELPGHVSEHAKDEVMEAISNLKSEGLNAAAISGSSGMIITVSCPICDATSDDIGGFIAHLWTSHLFLAGSDGVDHFAAWKSTLTENTLSPEHAKIASLLPWTAFEGHLRFGCRQKMFRCSSCLLHCLRGDEGRRDLSESQRAARNAVSILHLSLLRPEAEVIAELHPHRMQILRLYPEFVSHPVFADFDPPQSEI